VNATCATYRLQQSGHVRRAGSYHAYVCTEFQAIAPQA
jgi:hypothetical protein